jgi:hypothetical protein|tara:strand:+ start:922 stop:1227 length:306 start_codon:yes stop_codon:yes gene_type:complete
MKKSPLNHCSSDMMHSEAWNEMRKRSNSPLNMIEDKSHTHASKNNSVGIVGESQIWDGPLDQDGRPHIPGASNSGPRAMKLKLAGVPYSDCSVPITTRCKK